MPAGCTKRKASRNDAWTYGVIILNRLLQANVIAITRPDITHRRKAGIKHRPRVSNRRHCPETVGKFQPAIAADVSRPVKMDVHVDQARKDRFARQVDMLDVTAPLHCTRIGDTGNAAILANKHGRKFDGFAGQNVNHFVSRDYGVLCHRSI